jgi:hypothetical protein
MDWIAVSQSLSSRRWALLDSEIFHVCGKSKVSGLSDGFDRIDPGGNRFACARASDARAAQS